MKLFEIRTETRAAVLMRTVAAHLRCRDGDDCWYCGDPLGRDQTIEHLIPATACGGCRLTLGWNVVLAHNECNMVAGSNRLERKLELRSYLRAHGGRSALWSVRLQWHATDPYAMPGAVCHHRINPRRMTRAQKRGVIRAIRERRRRGDPLRVPIAELINYRGLVRETRRG